MIGILYSFCSPCVLRHHVGSLPLYVFPHGCHPSGCRDASPRPFRLQPHSGPFFKHFGSLWLSELCSFFPAALLTVPTLEVSYGWHRGLHCRFWPPLWLVGSVTWILPVFSGMLFCEAFFSNYSIVTYPAWYLAVSLPGSWLCYGFSLSFSCLLCHKD